MHVYVYVYTQACMCIYIYIYIYITYIDCHCLSDVSGGMVTYYLWSFLEAA